MPTISGLTPITAAQNAWKWCTQDFVAATLGGTPVIEGDQFGGFVLTINGGETLAVKAVPTQDTSQALGCSIDWAVDGVPQDLSLQYTTHNVEQTITITIPGSGPRRVQLFEQRCYITALTPQTSATVLLPTTQNSLWLVGASGTEGYYAYNPLHFTGGVSAFIFSWGGRLITSGLWDAVYVNAIDGYGMSDHVGSTAPTTGQINTWLTNRGAPRVNGSNSKGIVFEFGAGEYNNALWSAAQITTYYGMCADAAHAMFPTATIFFKTPIIESSPAEGTVNGAGVTQQGVRNAIIAMAATRSWVVLIHGYLGGTGGETQNTGQLQDGKHATPVAHRDSIFPYDYAILSAYVTPPTPPVVFPPHKLIPLPGGALLDVGNDPTVVSFDDPITLHTPLALSRLIERWKNKPNLAAILASYTDQLQLLENTLWEIIILRLTDYAAGAQQDVIGRIVGEERQGQNDAQYRARLKVRIRINQSFGTPEDVIEVLQMLDPALFLYQELGHAFFQIIYLSRPVSAAVASQIAGIVRQTRAAGIGATVTIPADNTRGARFGTTRNTATNQHIGFGTTRNLTTGGVFAHIVKA